MSNAIKFAKEIYRKIKARKKTKSDKLKRDYAKSITRDYKELLYYCKVRNIPINEVWDKAVTNG